MYHKPFHFKEFSIKQDRCAMKIGTDGVLLGAWASLEHQPQSILDIGSGTGLISLMLAQRSPAPLIDAIEIEESAYEQSVENFENSRWGDRLFCYHAGFIEFVEEMKEEEKYDLIISNPPFYAEDFKTENNQRNQARFLDALPFEHLLQGVSQLLSDIGHFNLVIPFKEEAHFLEKAKKYHLFASRISRVKGNARAEVKRSLLALTFNQFQPEVSELILEEERHHYTKAYTRLVSPFYLKL